MHKLLVALFTTTLLLTLIVVKHTYGYEQSCYNNGRNCNYRQRNYYSEKSYYAEASYYTQASYYAEATYSGGGGSNGDYCSRPDANPNQCSGQSTQSRYGPAYTGGTQTWQCDSTGYCVATNCNTYGVCEQVDGIGGPIFDRCDTGQISENNCTFNQPGGTQATYGGGYNQATYTGGTTGSVVVLTFADLNGNGIQDQGEPGIGDLGLTLQGGTTNQSTTTNPLGSGQFNNLSMTGSYNVTVTGFSSGLLLTGSNPRAVRVEAGGSLNNTNGSLTPSPTGTSTNTTTQNPFQQFIDWLYGIFGQGSQTPTPTPTPAATPTQFALPTVVTPTPRPPTPTPTPRCFFTICF